MHDLLPAWPLLSAFLVASLVLAVTPGPAVFYIVTRSVAQGRRCGLASVAGVALGNLGNAIGASLGLAVLFAVSSVAFTVVKYAGALYLVYLGVQAMRLRQQVFHQHPRHRQPTLILDRHRHRDRLTNLTGELIAFARCRQVADPVSGHEPA